ncbi:MAG: hypothetical protein A4E43_00720 [Methanosaeta sp. PtaB.Bin005]|nr:MAG: hypothetical protein A4E43_00720 [Methanosaeta sp. PtaB.Bin005]
MEQGAREVKMPRRNMPKAVTSFLETSFSILVQREEIMLVAPSGRASTSAGGEASPSTIRAVPLSSWMSSRRLRAFCTPSSIPSPTR